MGWPSGRARGGARCLRRARGLSHVGRAVPGLGGRLGGRALGLSPDRRAVRGGTSTPSCLRTFGSQANLSGDVAAAVFPDGDLLLARRPAQRRLRVLVSPPRSLASALRPTQGMARGLVAWRLAGL